MSYLRESASGASSSTPTGGRWGAVASSRDSESEDEDFSESGMPINRDSDTFAADTRAWLNRQVYDDYKNRYQPHEQELIDAVMGEEMLNESLGNIRVNESNAFNASRRSAKNRMDRYGISNNSGQQKSADTKSDLARASFTASAENATRQHVADRNMALISGSAMSRGAIEDL